ncbi:MAG: hypothetical protein HUU35_19205, partial [Armatimonadetes bacterium]|nr:hypothetical protein [Armatimonadota bacterium]
LRSGRPFFPLGLYHVRQQDLARVAAGGFNFVASHASTFPPDWPQPGDGVGYLEAAGQAGLTSVGLGAGIHRPEAAAKVFGHYRANPAVVTWYLADEPGGPGEQPEDLRRGYEQWAALDPTHPIFLLQNKPGEFYRYAPACDIFATDPYPIRADAAPPLGQVAEYTRGAVDAVFGQKPVWVALQCYTVHSATEPARELPPRLPTLDELRNMSYQALAAGARGLLYYAFDDTYFNNGQIRGVHLAREYPDFWAQLQTLAAEVGAHRELWCAPYATARPRADLPDLVVQSRPYQLDGALALLVVNLQRAPREAQVALPGLPDQVAVTDLLGGSPGGLAGGVLTDRLGPLQAKCYRIPTKAAAESRP